MLGIMLDCSRNAVINIKTAKKLIDNLKLMGYDTLMLYTEDTYEVENEKHFGYLRGSYSQQELCELVEYGEKQGIELIPCIQTLAHLNALFHWDEYKPIRDTTDILLAENERTHELLENMFKSLRKAFKTNKIHIGMDEAHMVGLGKYLDEHGFKNRFDILLSHLEKVCNLCKKYDFEPMMWSDMFFRLALKSNYKDCTKKMTSSFASVYAGLKHLYKN